MASLCRSTSNDSLFSTPGKCSKKKDEGLETTQKASGNVTRTHCRQIQGTTRSKHGPFTMLQPNGHKTIKVKQPALSSLAR